MTQPSIDDLNHILRNATAKIEGCLKEIEVILKETDKEIKKWANSPQNHNKY